MVIKSIEQIIDLKQKMHESADVAAQKLMACAEHSSPLGLLFEMKFNKIGVDPIEGTELNIIEQLNQLFSNLVVMEAVSDLLTRYPGKMFELHMGTAAGFDVESVDGEVVAECFAVTTAASNGKLKKDSEKLLAEAPVQKKYIYFYSQNDKDDALDRLYSRFPDITYKRIREFLR